MIEKINLNDQKVLLDLARTSITRVLTGRPKPEIKFEDYSPLLRENGASFVTLLSKPGQQLRGCIGTLEAYQPLVMDVREHAIAAALEDYRFPPVQNSEMSRIVIEISYLSPTAKMEYESPADLLNRLVAGRDGVILKDGSSRATFLPQVWEKIGSKEQFLSQLCLKMGANADLWRKKPLQIFTYQVQEFHE